MRPFERIACSMLLLAFVIQSCSTVAPTPRVSFPVDGDQRDALLCRPEGKGPFPAVVFNHGTIVDQSGWPGAATRGYRMDLICQALAADGFLAFLPIREKRPRGMKHMSYEEYYRDVVSRAVDHVKGLPDVDRARIALVGFSMGGFTSLKVAVERRDLKALLLLAPATVHGLLGEAAKNVGSLNAPVLLLVETSDEGHILKGAANLEQALQKHGKKARVIRYNRGGGHKLFYTVDYYWPDVRAFLHENLGG